MLPTIATGNVGSALAGEYEVANSLRFNDGSSDYLNKTFSSAGNRKTFTYSCWLKRGNLDNSSTYNMRFFGSSDSLQFWVNPNTVGKLNMNIAGGELTTNRLFRDVSAWYHIVLAVDTTQATSSNRLKLYINGVQETSFSTETYPSLNADSSINNNVEHSLGRQLSTSRYYDGYMAECVFIDGSQLDATSFGEFDSDSPNIWKPIDVSGLTFGTNGFYLDFENSSSLGADVSGNGNNFTVNNLTSVDQSTDTCTNNFATLNPLTNTRGTSQNFKEGNLQIDGTGSGAGASASTISTSTSGKYYIECKIDSLGSGYAEFFAIATSSYANHTLGYFETNTDTILWNLDYRSGQSKIRKDGSSIITTPTSFSNGDIIGMAIDVDNGKIYFHRNGTYVNYSGTQNPSSGSNGITLPTSSDGYLIAASVDNNSGSGTTLTMNFGSPSFSISSGNSDGNGYGNFEYSVPSGYYALNSKNLAEYG